MSFHRQSVSLLAFGAFLLLVAAAPSSAHADVDTTEVDMPALYAAHGALYFTLPTTLLFGAVDTIYAIDGDPLPAGWAVPQLISGAIDGLVGALLLRGADHGSVEPGPMLAIGAAALAVGVF